MDCEDAPALLLHVGLQGRAATMAATAPATVHAGRESLGKRLESAEVISAILLEHSPYLMHGLHGREGLGKRLEPAEVLLQVVDPDHRPAPLRQPDRVAAGPAAEVERRPAGRTLSHNPR